MSAPQVQRRDDFHEPPWRRAFSSAYIDQLTSVLPAEWTLQREEAWVHARCPTSKLLATPIIQGFKIHVSSAPLHARRVLDLVVPVCVEHAVDFKIAGDPAMLDLLNSKRYARGSSGKFMTIYPPDEVSFKRILERLYERTRAEEIAGPRVLSDRQYKDSKILYYRYGGFLSPRRVNVDGTLSHFLISPTGVYVLDQRPPYFQLPDWVSDPFGGSPSVERPEHVLLAGRYQIEEAVGFSNAGGVYYAIDTLTETSVLVKEARPFTNCFRVGERTWDAVHLLKREYDMLQRLASSGFTPAPIALVDESDHLFLIEQRIDGLSLRSYWALNEFILAPYICRPGRIESWLPYFKHVGETLIGMIEAVHDRGILLGDVSPDNIMIDPDSQAMWFVDFESAVLLDDEPEILKYAAMWETPGFAHPARSSRNRLLPFDDLYATAMVLYGAVAPVNPLFALKPDAASLFLDRFVALGVPAAVKETINSLSRGDVADAIVCLRSLETDKEPPAERSFASVSDLQLIGA